MRRSAIIIASVIFFVSCGKTLVLTDTETEYTTIDSTLAPDTETSATISPYKSRLDSTMDAVLCQSAQSLQMSRKAMETALGNFMTDLSYEWIVRETPDSLPKPDFAILNKGGIRSSLPGGDVRVRHIYELMPFDNYLVTVELSGEETMVLFKYLARVGGQPISNATVGIKNGKPIDITIDGKPFNEERTYIVVTSNYLAGGGDNMSFFVGQPRKTYGLLRDYIIRHCEELDEAGKMINAKVDGRVWADK